MKQRVHWLVLHGFVRGVASMGARRGDVQARLIADPTVKADPVAFYEEVRARGPLVRSRVGYITADHAIGHELLRSDDFRVLSIGGNLPAPLRWLEARTRDDLLHPLRPPSLLAVVGVHHQGGRRTTGWGRADRYDVAGSTVARTGCRRYRRPILRAASGVDHQRHSGGARR
jgi:hypothetical protein